MDNDDFEWDDAKAAKNYADHGVTFEAAKAVFKDPFAIERLDDRENYGEDRYVILGMVDGCVLCVAYAPVTKPFASYPHAEPSRRKDVDTMKTTPKRTTSAKINWSRLDAMTEAERHAAALGDPDAQPLTPEDFQRMRRTPQAKIIRRALGLSQEDFAARFHIPLGTLRDWEQGRAEPDQAARAYLKVIAREPETVRKALKPTGEKTA